MNLREIHHEVNARIHRVDFSLLWEGFKPLKFALYNEKECCLDGEYIEKTDQFLANTAIHYNGEYIAIWRLGEDVPDYDVLASKIIHEMFHGFQYENQESRFPNELEALRKYAYSVANLTVKMKENHLISQLVDTFDKDLFDRLLTLRKMRQANHPYEYRYEALIEQIEGSANHVELESLRQLSTDKFHDALERTKRHITDANNLIPIRIISYSVGALLLRIIKNNTTILCEHFIDHAFSQTLLDNIAYQEVQVEENPEVKATLDQYHRQTRTMIDAALAKNDCVLEGKYPLIGVNVYDARRLDHYIISTYFVAYKNADNDAILHGDYLVELDKDLDITKVYTLK